MDQGVRLGGEPDCYLDTRQAAAVLGLSARTLEGYRVTGGGPPFLTYCNRIHYLRADLYDWVAESRRRSTSDDGIAGTEGTEAIVGCWCAWTLRARKDGFLSVRELAALLGVNRRILDGYRAKGVGPAFEKVNGRVRYPLAGVEAWLASGRRTSTSEEKNAAPDSECGPGEGGPEPSPVDGGDTR